MAVHQLVPTFVSGDATGRAAIQFRALLRRLGHHGEIYAGETEAAFAPWVRPARELSLSKDDWVLYHHGIASALSGQLLHLRCRRAVIYHNITPARFYEGEPLWDSLVGGRAQLAAMAPFVDLAIGVSQFNSAEMVQAGYRDVHTVPLFVEPRRFGEDRADPTESSRLWRPSPTMIFVSRVMPHKRFEDLIALQREVLRLRPDSRLLLVGPYQAGGDYFRRLARAARTVRNVFFLGRLSQAQLVSAYRSASVFVSMSEHEGFGLPLLEAMAADLPVLAYGAAAVPETLGGSGIAFDQKRFALLAEVVDELNRNSSLREAVLRGEKRRLGELSADAATEKLAAAIGRRTVLPRSPSRRGPPRIAFVVQRYGEVTGGAEKLAHEVARRMKDHWQLTVLTTCSRDHLTWENEFPAGESDDGGIRIVRFPTLRGRSMRKFNGLSSRLFREPSERMREEHWIWEQGPQVPELLQHLSEHSDAYDGFVFFTYLYLPTAWGLPLVAKRALLVPTAHDEAALKFDAYSDVFELPRALLCNTPEERDLIEARFPKHARARVVGVGIESHPARAARFREIHGIDRPYLLYVGRVEEGKGVTHLLRHHAALVRRDGNAPELVLAGDASMEVAGERVHYLGRISEQDKFDAIAGALAVVIPSRFESLSLLALEAFAQGAPVLANAQSDVLAGQVRRSGAGVTYLDAVSFAQGVERIARDRPQLRGKGLAFARKHRWPRVIQAYKQEMKRILDTR